MTEYVFLEPLDVLFLRGNKLFGGPGDFGEALMPPWPSVAAGAIRSRIMADHDVSFDDFKAGKPLGNAQLTAVLGSYEHPGDFRLVFFGVARRANGSVEPYFPPPADVVVDENNVILIQPRPLPDAIQCSKQTALAPVLAQEKQSKPKSGLWLNGPGLMAYLRGEALDRDEHFVETSKLLWKTDARLGIALDATKRSAAEGQIYTADTIAMRKNVGFLAGIEGAGGLLPKEGHVRLGGDGRGARITPVPEASSPLMGKGWSEGVLWRRIEETRCFKLVLTTPGLFAQGWRLPGLGDDNVWHGPEGITARLVSACVPRAQVISGWDLASWRPKPALRAAPVGSVYWFEDLQGSIEGLRKLAAEGFWAIDGYPDRQRRAEGFNHVLIAA